MSNAKKSVVKRVRKNVGNVSEDKFVDAYLQAFTAKEGVKGVADRLNIAQGSVTTRASNMRKRGISLPNFPVGGGNKSDVAGCNAKIEAALKAAKEAEAAAK